MFSRKMALLAGALAAQSMSALAGSAAQVPLQPTSKWNVDYDVAQCTASRDYGTAEKPLLLILKPSPFGGVTRLIVVRKGGYAGLARELEGSVQFGDQPKITTRTLKFGGGERTTLYSVNLSTAAITAQQSAKSVAFATTDTSYRFAIDSIPEVLRELEKCRVDLLEMYNADETKVRQRAVPKEPLSKLYSPRDYPTAALIGQDQGLVAISLLVDETGKVADCSVDSSAGVATLDTMSCYVIQQRASFAPAVGTDGKPVRSVYNQRILWKVRP